jgi:hypothetical protein
VRASAPTSLNLEIVPREGNMAGWNHVVLVHSQCCEQSQIRLYLVGILTFVTVLDFPGRSTATPVQDLRGSAGSGMMFVIGAKKAR